MEIIIRKVLPEDCRDFLRIYFQYSIDLKKITNPLYRKIIEERGFFVGSPLSYQTMSSSPFFKCAIVKGKVVGFLRSDKFSNEPCGIDSNMRWFNFRKVKKVFEEEDAQELGLVMIDRDFIRRGTALNLFKNFEKYIKNKGIKNLFSWNVSKPMNKPALAFHKKMGFVHVATYQSKKAWGILKYQSYLFYKKF